MDPLSPKYVSAGYATWSNALFMFGGLVQLSSSPQNVFYYPGQSFQSIFNFPFPVLYPAAATVQNKIYIAGGVSAGLTAVGICYAYDPMSAVFTQLPTTLNMPRVGAVGAGVADTFYVIGGSTNFNGSALGTNESLNMATSRFYLMQKD